MSTHSYTRLWTHLIWETLNRELMINQPQRKPRRPNRLFTPARNLHEDQLL